MWFALLFYFFCTFSAKIERWRCCIEYRLEYVQNSQRINHSMSSSSSNTHSHTYFSQQTRKSWHTIMYTKEWSEYVLLGTEIIIFSIHILLSFNIYIPPQFVAVLNFIYVRELVLSCSLRSFAHVILSQCFWLTENGYKSRCKNNATSDNNKKTCW